MRFFITGILFISAFYSFAQRDTVHLKEVNISGEPYQRFSAGGDFKQIQLSDHDVELADALADESSIFFKSYGNHQLTSISFRGTGAQHTNVLWHGIQANYPTLGQMDFSQWPVWMMESVDLITGGDGALYGSGAIGGTVLIDSELKHDDQTNAVVTRGLGSFGYHYGGVKANISLGDFTIRVKSFRSDLRNDFKYEVAGQTKKLLYSGVHNEGYDGLLQYRKSHKKYFLHASYFKGDRSIQPGIISTGSQGDLITKNLRIALGMVVEKKQKSFSYTLAYLLNDQLYYDTIPTAAHQLSGVINYHRDWKKGLSFRVGANANAFTVVSENYQKDQRDYQLDFYSSAEFRPFKWWTGVINLRQSIYKHNAPFTPSFGNEFRLINTQKTSLKLKAKTAFGFRYPTLNDRYWIPGGNPDLNPETSLTTEGSVHIQQTFTDFNYLIKLSTYKTWSDDWIIWLPVNGAIWSPVNYRQVEITGINLSGSIKTKFFKQEELTFSYDNIQSLNQSGSSAGRQMPYTPSELFSTKYNWAFNKVNLFISESYTGRRFNTLDNAVDPHLDPYWLLDFGFNKNFQTRLAEITLSGTLKNILDERYQVINNYAMPGRNFEIRMTLKIK